MTSRIARKAAVKTWLEAITASSIGAGDGAKVFWRGETSAPWADDYLICSLGVPQTVGRDTTTYEEDATAPAGQELRHYQRGARTVSLYVQARSLRTDGADDAGEFIRRIIDRLQLDDWDSTLGTAGLAFARILTNNGPIEGAIDGRQLMVYELDLLMNASSEEEGAPTTYIETVEAETEFYGPDGSLLPVQFSGEIEVG